MLPRAPQDASLRTAVTESGERAAGTCEAAYKGKGRLVLLPPASMASDHLSLYVCTGMRVQGSAAWAWMLARVGMGASLCTGFACLLIELSPQPCSPGNFGCFNASADRNCLLLPCQQPCLGGKAAGITAL